MLTKRLQFIVAAALAVVALAVPPAFAQGRGSSALAAGPKDPLAALQSQIDLLKQQLGGITGSRRRSQTCGSCADPAPAEPDHGPGLRLCASSAVATVSSRSDLIRGG